MKKLVLFLFCVVCISFQSFASHVMGAQITYKAVASKKFEVTLKLYRDCRGIPMGNPGTFAIVCATGGSTRSFSYSKTQIRDITPRCKTDTSGPCNPPNTTVSAEGIEEHTYVGIIDFNITPLSTDVSNGCCNFRIYYDECCRNGAINTGSAGNFYSTAYIDVCKGPQNSSPQFKADPIAFLACNHPFYFNVSAVDSIDGDSLIYELVPAKESAGTNFSYGGGYSATKPLTPYLPGSPNQIVPTANHPIGFYLDRFNGDLIFTPTGCTEVGPVVIAISEYRKDSSGTYTKLGEVTRDLEFIVRTSAGNNPPTVVGSGGYNYVACEGTELCFKITGKDQQFVPPPPQLASTPDSLTLEWSNSINGATFTLDSFTRISTASPKISSLEATFCWTPPVGSARSIPYNFVVTVNDNSCKPRPQQAVRGFTIKVKKQATGSRSYQQYSCGKLKVIGSAGTATQFSWLLMDSTGKALSTNFVNKTSSSKMTDSFFFKKPGRYYMKFSANNADNCPLVIIDTLDINSGFYALINTGITDTTVCHGQSLALNANVIGGTAPYKYKWLSVPAGPGNDSGSSYSVTVLGNRVVELKVTDSTGCQMSGVLNIKSSGKFTLGADVSKCSGDTAELVGPPGMNQYLWLPDSANTRSVRVSKAANYILRVIDSIGCSFADTLKYDTIALPTLKFKGSEYVFCKGDSVAVSADSGYVSYLWSTGQSKRSIYLKTMGKVYLTLMNSSGCKNTDSLFARPDSVSAFTFSAIQQSAKTFLFTPTLIDSTHKYYWTFGDGDTAWKMSTTHSYSSAGTYKVCLRISTQYSCSDTFCSMVTVTGIKDKSAELPLLIYPNPFNDKIDISVELPVKSELAFSIFDLTGREIIKIEGESGGPGIYKKSIDLGERELPPGVYMLKLDLNGAAVYYRIVKKL